MKRGYYSREVCVQRAPCKNVLCLHTPKVEAVAAKEAFATDDRKGHDHTITDLPALRLRTDLDNLTHVLMAEDVAAFFEGMIPP